MNNTLLNDAISIFASLTHEQKVMFMYDYMTENELIEEFHYEYDHLTNDEVTDLIRHLDKLKREQDGL